MAGIAIRGLSKVFRGKARALDAVDFEVADGELLILVGPSGSGKTTLLRLIAGLDEPTAGTIEVGGRDLAGVPPHRRNVAMVFQNLGLYSHLTVRGNLEFGSRASGVGSRESEIVDMLGIGHLLDRYPAELSGGEQQRVAVGRAIVRQPAALLLDEPLSSLDAPLRRELRRELKQLQRRLGMPTIYVTHDQAEALALGDRIAVLDQGQLQQVGSPREVYNRPANRFVAEFLGPEGMNWMEGELRSDGGGVRFTAGEWGVDWMVDGAGAVGAESVVCGFRPEDVRRESAATLRGSVTAVESLGSVAYAQLGLTNLNDRLNRVSITVQLEAHEELPKVGETLTIGINADRLHWFDTFTGKRIEPGFATAGVSS